jgi:hypothetical protein
LRPMSHSCPLGSKHSSWQGRERWAGPGQLASTRINIAAETNALTVYADRPPTHPPGPTAAQAVVKRFSLTP